MVPRKIDFQPADFRRDGMSFGELLSIPESDKNREEGA
jgi:hypothetical protein